MAAIKFDSNHLSHTRTLQNIDIKYCADAAVRCGCVCSGLILAELADEERRSFRQTVDQAGGIYLLLSLSCNCKFYFYFYSFLLRFSLLLLPHTLSLSHFPSDTFGMSNTFSTSLTMTLVEAYRQIHDPDALQGVDQSVALSLQAMSYTHTG